MAIYVLSTSIIYTIIFSIVMLSSTKFELTEEDKYVKLYGNKANNSHEWYTIKAWCDEEDQLKVKKFCAAAHKRLLGRGRYMIESLAYKVGILSFNCSRYQPMRVVFLEYKIRTSDIPQYVKDYWMVKENETWYITQGLSKQCVFYLGLVNSSAPEFYLQKQICGLKHKYV